jgi:predicted dehydrogenase
MGQERVVTKYRVLVAGLGKRGMHHAAAFAANPRFEVAGLCEIDEGRLKAAAAKYGGAAAGTDARALAAEVKPDVFCFCTMPEVRSQMIRAGIEGGARLIAFEKPVALDSIEGARVRELIEGSGVKAVVSHQHRYGQHYQAVKDVIASGALGRVHTVYGTASGWMMHMLSHLIDYMSWYAGEPEAEWVMAQMAGRGKMTDAHASPDYMGGFINFAGGVRGVVECGGGAPDVPEVDYWWRKCRIGAQGTDGFAEVLTGGGWRAVTKNGVSSGPGSMNYDLDMPPYIQEMADWLDDNSKVHQCNLEHALLGAEIMLAMQRSAAEGGQVALPLTIGADEQALLKARLNGKPVLVSCEQNRKEFGLA